MARKTCNHTGFPSLSARLSANEVFECPTCRMQLYIHEIEEVQAALEHRRGIFESKATARAAEERNESAEKTVHSALVKRWRLAKIGLYKDLCLFEELRIEGAKKMRWKIQLDKAFELWEEFKQDCCNVPGYTYAKGPVDLVGGQEEPKIMQDFDYSPIQGVGDEESDEINGGWQIVKLRATVTKRFSDDITSATRSDASHQKGISFEVQSHHEVIRYTKVPSKIELGSYWDGRNRFDLLRDIDFDEVSGLSEPLAVTATPRIPEVRFHLTNGPAARIPSQSSPLKCKRSSTCPDKPRTQRNAHMADEVTIICGAGPCNTVDLPPGQSSYKRPHFSYTTAEQARRWSTFRRCSTRYKPHTWTTPSDYEKLNTSHYKTHWDLYDTIQLMADDTDKFGLN